MSPIYSIIITLVAVMLVLWNQPRDPNGGNVTPLMNKPQNPLQRVLMQRK